MELRALRCLLKGPLLTRRGACASNIWMNELVSRGVSEAAAADLEWRRCAGASAI